MPHPIFSPRFSAPSTQLPGPSTEAPAPSTRLPGPLPRLPNPSTRLPGPSIQFPGPSIQLPGPSTRLPAPSSRLLGLPTHSGLVSSRSSGPVTGKPTGANQLPLPHQQPPDSPLDMQAQILFNPLGNISFPMCVTRLSTTKPYTTCANNHFPSSPCWQLLVLFP